MSDKAKGGFGIFSAGRLLLASMALLLIAIFVACSGDAPTEAPTAVAPSTAPTAPPATPVPAAEVLATPTAAPPSPAAPAAQTVAPTEPPATPAQAEPTDVAPDVQDELTPEAEEVYSLVVELVDELGHRVSGTPEELHAAEILKARFDALGYSAQLQPFSFEHFDLMGFIQGQQHLATIEVQSPVQLNLPGLPLTTTPKGGKGSGVLAPVPLEADNQTSEADLEGKVALIQAGEISLGDLAMVQKLQDRVNEVAEAGAVAAVVDGSTAVGVQDYRPLLGGASAVPALMVPPAPPGATNPMSQAPPGIEIVVSVQIQTNVLKSNNVVAEMKGEGEGVVVVGAHYDIVPQTDLGPNDNTTGTAIVLSLAKALADETLPYTVRFVLFGAEELGLYGSGYYVSALAGSELDQIKAMLNFDVVGTGPFIAMYGASELTGLALDAASDLGIGAQIGMLPPGASSDHQSFELAGVPVLMLYAPDVSRIHTPEDKLEFVQPERLGDAFLITEALMKSPDFAQ